MALAHQLVKEGKIGRIFHVRCVYLQDWGGPDTPLLWRFQKKLAGSGAHGDLNAHIMDMARFVTGDEIVEISGAIAETFIKERTILSAGSAGGIAAGAKGGAKKGKVDVDDAVLFLARFKKGAVGSFEATPSGHRLQEPERHRDPRREGRPAVPLRGHELPRLLRQHRRPEGPRLEADHVHQRAGIIRTSAAWWPDAHILGYEHGFINQAADIMKVLGGKKPVVPLPDFADAYETQRVLEAALLSAENRCAIKMSEVK